MPKLTHTVETTYIPSFRADKIAGMFDVPVEQKLTKSWDIDLPIEDEDWNIGLIVGPSGCGKTTIAKKIFGEAVYHTGFEWSPEGTLTNDFPAELGVKEITDALSHVGFSSPPAWLLPFRCLSNGQMFRAEMARLALSPGELFVVDEFTSVVDRTVAQVSSAAVQKLIRKRGKKLVAVSCHDDIKDWLEPDWVYQVDTGMFTRGRLRRPELKLRLFQCHHSAWRIFRGHHYLSADINKAAKCFIATINDRPVAFVAALHFPHPHTKNIWRGHRTVVLPDFQGVGIGNRVSEAVGDYFLALGKRYTSLTSHPAMIAHRNNSPKWVLTRAPGQVPKTTAKGAMGSSAGRLTASFEYVGENGGNVKIKSKKESRRGGE